MITLCYVCRKVKGAKGWVVPKYPNIDKMTEVSHGLCPECYIKERARLKKEAVEQRRRDHDDHV